jgi:hypothetical protein
MSSQNNEIFYEIAGISGNMKEIMNKNHSWYINTDKLKRFRRIYFERCLTPINIWFNWRKIILNNNFKITITKTWMNSTLLSEMHAIKGSL